MATIRNETAGTEWDTRRLPENIEPMFCSSCGCRVGWYDSGFGDEPVGYCDDCAGDLCEHS